MARSGQRVLRDRLAARSQDRNHREHRQKRERRREFESMDRALRLPLQHRQHGQQDEQERLVIALPAVMVRRECRHEGCERRTENHAVPQRGPEKQPADDDGAQRCGQTPAACPRPPTSHRSARLQSWPSSPERGQAGAQPSRRAASARARNPRRAGGASRSKAGSRRRAPRSAAGQTRGSRG
jgi:hypothetical protein